MGNKTPPLVIPVVIDSSGVNRGLNNVNSRLRQGVAGGAAGAAGGGFGTAGAAAGAALGAGAAVGIFGAGNPGGGGTTPSDGTTFRARARSSTAWWRERTRGLASYGPMFTATARVRAKDAFESFDPVVEGREAISATIGTVQRLANQRELYRARATRRKFARNVRSAYEYWGGNPLDQSFSGMMGDISGNLGVLKRGTALGLAAGAAAYGAYANLGQRISNIDNLVGSRNYGRMRQAQLRAFDQGPQPSALQNFMLGGMKIAGQGKATMFEKDAASFQQGFGNLMRAGGMGYEILRRDPVMALELWLAATPMGKLFGLDFQGMMKTEIQYLNWKAAQK